MSQIGVSEKLNIGPSKNFRPVWTQGNRKKNEENLKGFNAEAERAKTDRKKKKISSSRNFISARERYSEGL